MANGIELHYVEGWHAIAEANRIFGFDAWDRQTLATNCVWSGGAGEGYAAAYTAKVRIRVRAGDATILRDGSGSGEARAPTRGQAHDLALKAAETDATKRALTTFGNPFGLALYDREQAGVRKPRQTCSGPWTLRAGLRRGGAGVRQAGRLRGGPAKEDERSRRHRGALRSVGEECRHRSRHQSGAEAE